MSRYARNDDWDSDPWGASAPGSSFGSSGSSMNRGGASATPVVADQWASETQKLHSNIQTIGQNVQDIEKFINRVGTNEDSDELRQRMYV